MAEKLLTEQNCKNSKPKEKVYYLNDGAGLRLRVRPDGSRTWIFRYSLNGKDMSHGLGAYPRVSLQMARDRLNEAKNLVSIGHNVSAAKRVAKTKQIEKDMALFSVIAEEWFNHSKPSWSKNYEERNEGLIRRYLLPDLGNLPIDAINEQHLLLVLKKHYDKGTKESARRARGIASQIFSFAKHTHRIKTNPAKELADNPYLKKPAVKHFKALPKHSVGQLIIELEKTGDEQKLDFNTVCALRLALYTGLRDMSLRGAKWNEIDLNSAVWTVPAARMKSGKSHQVPLPSQAILALTSLSKVTGASEDAYLFPSSSKYGFMAENTLRLALHRLGFKVTLHGMRSLITDVLNENGFHPDAVERQLDHIEKNKVRRAYLRTDFMEKRHEMMQWFANWCDDQALETANKVLKMKEAA